MAIQKKTNPLLAAVLAWAIPGAGHWYLGRPVRAVVLFAVIQALFWSGVAIGGVLTVNPREEMWWFAGQACSGVSGVASWYRGKKAYEEVRPEALKRAAKVSPPPGSGTGDDEIQRWNANVAEATERVLAEKRLALVLPGSDIALLYSGVAGMLNLLCIFDALMLSMMGRHGEPRPAEASP